MEIEIEREREIEIDTERLMGLGVIKIFQQQ